jgi:hypothetical protein
MTASASPPAEAAAFFRKLFTADNRHQEMTRNERIRLEMKIMKYRLLMQRVTDEEFLRRAAAQIAELENKLRESDDQ